MSEHADGLELATVAIEKRSRGLALLCLLGAGAMLGLSTNLARAAAIIELSPLTFLTWSAAGAALILLVFAALRRQLPVLDGTTIRYSLVAGFVSLAAPNLIAFTAAPRIGVGFVALMIALPPVFTYAGAVALSMERFDIGRASAVFLSLAGTVWIALHKLTGAAPQTGWILVTLAIPVLLATGNIYRSRAWPKGASPEALSPAMLIAATLLLVAIAPFSGISGNATVSAEQLGLIVIQALVFSAQYLLFFILQRHGGPVLLSLMGAVAAVLGIPMAMVAFDEALPAQAEVGGFLIAAGLLLLTWRSSR